MSFWAAKNVRTMLKMAVNPKWLVFIYLFFMLISLNQTYTSIFNLHFKSIVFVYSGEAFWKGFHSTYTVHVTKKSLFALIAQQHWHSMKSIAKSRPACR